MNDQTKARILAILQFFEDKSEVTTIPRIHGYNREQVLKGINHCKTLRFIADISPEGAILLQITDTGLDFLDQLTMRN